LKQHSIFLSARTGAKSNLVTHLRCASAPCTKAEAISEPVVPKLKKRRTASVQRRRRTRHKIEGPDKTEPNEALVLAYRCSGPLAYRCKVSGPTSF
jgi:hypothetical protein